MNERIRELATQAGFKTDRLGHLFGSDDIEKFAELIVQECCEAIRQDDAFNGGKFMRTIKEHFGVK